MRNLAVIIAIFCLAGCTSDQSGAPGAQPAEQSAPADAAPVDASGKPDAREIAVKCLDLFREKRFQDALAVCREAEKKHPGDPQLLKAIEGAEEQLGQ